MTRAKGTLHLFHARKRSGAVSLQTLDHAGGHHSLSAVPFLSAIPKTWREDRFHRP